MSLYSIYDYKGFSPEILSICYMVAENFWAKPANTILIRIILFAIITTKHKKIFLIKMWIFLIFHCEFFRNFPLLTSEALPG